jgi:phosphate/sulfate permease
VGMTISNVGSSCVNWSFGGVGGIFASWIISPVLSGVLAIIFYRSALSVIFGSQDPRGRILFALPWIFSVVCFVMFILILTKSPSAQVLMSLPFSLSVCLCLSLTLDLSLSPSESSFCLSSQSLPLPSWAVLCMSSRSQESKPASLLEKQPSPTMA